MTQDLFGNRANVDDGQRSALDWYPTPPFMVRSLVYHVPEIAGSLVLECASGDGAIAEVLRDEFGCTVITNDIDPGHQAGLTLDATDAKSWPFFALAAAMASKGAQQPADWVITNPPFNVAFEMLQYAVEFATVGVAFLLRKTFLEPTQDRGPWLSAHPPSRIIGQPRHTFRPGFTGSGGDMVACDWTIWDRIPLKNIHPIEIDHLAKSRTKGSV